MGLAVTVFTPEGIVVASDGLAEVRNDSHDQTYFHDKQKRLFVYQNKFAINIICDGYYQGLPYAYHIYRIFEEFNRLEFNSTYDFSTVLNNKICHYFEGINGFAIYVAGIDIDSTGRSLPSVYLVENNSVTQINKGINGNIVYNYHTIGHSYWVNRLLMKMPSDNDMIDDSNGDIDIDFSKFSLDEAVDFAITIIDVSRKMDIMAHLRRSIGNTVKIVTIPLYGEICETSV